jgi:hypothetical protein
MDDYTGGPAYPLMDTDLTGLHIRHPGKTLRDDFAGKALAALICEPPWMRGQVSSLVLKLCLPSDNVALQYAAAAYKLADAMIMARDIAPGDIS